MSIDRKLIGPQSWREVPIFWWAAVRFWVEMKLRHGAHPPRGDQCKGTFGMMGVIGGFAAVFGIFCLVAILMVCASGVAAIMVWAIFAIFRFFFGAS